MDHIMLCQLLLHLSTVGVSINVNALHVNTVHDICKATQLILTSLPYYCYYNLSNWFLKSNTGNFILNVNTYGLFPVIEIQ